MAKTVYDIIKKQNGERFARAIRDHHDAIFEIPGIVDMLKYAGHDAKPLLPYLDALLTTPPGCETDEDPFELLNRAGYTAVYADTLEKQNSIKKYFAPGEELCTFRDPNRYKDYFIINAVRHNVDQIKRENFEKPERQDEYGTSVISIQILKTGGFISIKNRYNHSVQSPDSTYENNPDNIIPGLSTSLQKYFNVDFHASKVALSDNHILINGKIIKYNHEIDNIYIGDCFYVKNGVVYEIDKNHEMILDNFKLNIQNKILSEICGFRDTFFKELFNSAILRKKLNITKTKDDNHNTIYHIMADNVEIAAVCDGKLIKLMLPDAKVINEDFLYYNQELRSIDLPKATHIGDNFLASNTMAESINLPSATNIGKLFLPQNNCIKSINLPKATHIGDYFLTNNKTLMSVQLPKAEIIGDSFLNYNGSIESIDLPSTTKIGSRFLFSNIAIELINLPNIKEIGEFFLADAVSIQSIDLPNVESIGNGFMECNRQLESINIPKAKFIGARFLQDNYELKSINLPNAEIIGDSFLNYNDSIESIYAPRVIKIGDEFLYENKKLESIDLPNVKYISNAFLTNNEIIKSINLPNVEKIGNYFLNDNFALTSIDLPKATDIGDCFLDENCAMQSVNMPNAIHFGERILPVCRYIPHFNMPHNPLRYEINNKRKQEKNHSVANAGARFAMATNYQR